MDSPNLLFAVSIDIEHARPSDRQITAWTSRGKTRPPAQSNCMMLRKPREIRHRVQTGRVRCGAVRRLLGRTQRRCFVLASDFGG